MKRKEFESPEETPDSELIERQSPVSEECGWRSLWCHLLVPSIKSCSSLVFLLPDREGAIEHGVLLLSCVLLSDNRGKMLISLYLLPPDYHQPSSTTRVAKRQALKFCLLVVFHCF